MRPSYELDLHYAGTAVLILGSLALVVAMVATVVQEHLVAYSDSIAKSTRG